MAMPKRTDNWDRRKERRCRRRGEIGIGFGSSWISTMSRRHPFICVPWAAAKLVMVTKLEVEG
jgi:hypothetical protein